MKVLPILNYNFVSASSGQIKPELKNAYALDTVSFSANPKAISQIKFRFKNPIKIFFSDIDGTLRDYNGAVPKSAKEGIKKLHQKGIPVILATARSSKEAETILQEIGVKMDYLITEQGAVIIDKQGIEIYRNALSHKDTNEIIKLAKEFKKHDPNTHLLLYFDGYPYSNTDVVFKHDNAVQIKHVKSFDKMLKDGKIPTKAVLFKTNSQAYSDLDGIKEHFRACLGKNLNVVDTCRWLCEVSNSDTSKGAAIKIITQRMGINIKNAAGIGDAENDLEMLKTLNREGGLSIAMGNGVPKLKDEAQFVTSELNRDGYANAINAILSHNKLSNKT